MLNIGSGELLLILVVALLVLGPARLPELARSIGKMVREFRRQTDDVRVAVEREFYRMDDDVQADPGKNILPPPPAVAEGTVSLEAHPWAQPPPAASNAPATAEPAAAAPAPTPATEGDKS